jgi:hypothetical protein
MKTMMIEARDADKELLGTQEIKVPENMDDLHELFKDDEIIDLVMRSYVIDVQRKLRTEARGPRKETDQVKAFKKLSVEEQEKLIALLKNAQ